MKGLVLNAKWEPRKNYNLTQAEIETVTMRHTDMIFALKS